MDPEERRLLERAVRLSEENNSMLRKMRRAARWAAAFQIIYWVIIIGLAIGAYYYAEPYIKGTINAYQQFQNEINTIGRFVK